MAKYEVRAKSELPENRHYSFFNYVVCDTTKGKDFGIWWFFDKDNANDFAAVMNMAADFSQSNFIGFNNNDHRLDKFLEKDSSEIKEEDKEQNEEALKMTIVPGNCGSICTKHTTIEGQQPKRNPFYDKIRDW
jgi:hypothetical protein